MSGGEEAVLRRGGDGEERGRMAGDAAGEGCTAGDGTEEAGRRHSERGGGGAQRGRRRRRRRTEGRRLRRRTPLDEVIARGRRPAPEGTTTGGGSARGRHPRCKAVQRRLVRRMAVQRASGDAREGGRTAVAASATGGGRLRSISSGGNGDEH